MSTIRNGQILLYCHFNKDLKGPGTSFQSPAFSQKYVRNICHTAHYLTKFHFDRTYDSKEISIRLTCIMQQRLWRHKIWNLLASQKHKSLNIENKTFFFFFKKFINYTSSAILWHSFVAEVTFNQSYWLYIFTDTYQSYWLYILVSNMHWLICSIQC